MEIYCYDLSTLGPDYYFTLRSVLEDTQVVTDDLRYHVILSLLFIRKKYKKY